MNIIPINQVSSNKASTDSFTNDQKEAYKNLIGFIDSPFDAKDYKRALVGPAGTGKTYLVKALILNSSMSYSLIGLAAPTHKACRVLGESIHISGIKVNTLQSDLGLRLNFDVEKFDLNNPPFDPKGKIKIGNYKLYIVDESSMINRGLCTFLERTCVTNKCKIIYIGDSSQLAPVNEKYSSAFKGTKTFSLKEIVRQGDDNPVSYLLELLRYDIEHKSYKFLEHIQRFKEKFNADYTKGYAVCSPDEFDTKNDLIISYVTIVNQFNDCIIKNSEEYILKDIANSVHPQYGMKGFVVRFQAIHGGDISTSLFVVDHSDKFTIEKYIQISNSMISAAKTARASLKAQKWRDYYTFKESCLLLTNIISPVDRKIMFSRDLDYGFSLTSHKSQGSTFDTSLVDVNDIVFDRNGYPYSDAEEVNRRLYVACSRCKNKLYLKFGK